MKEIWTSVTSYEELYEVSNLGRIRSFHKNKVTYLSKNLNTDGYEIVCLHKDKSRQTLRVHRIVMCSFHEKPLDDEFIVNHINGIKTDNRLINLEFVTPQENSIHALEIGLVKTKLTKNQILEIKNLLDTERASTVEISRMYGISRSVVSAIKNDKIYQYVSGNLPNKLSEQYKSIVKVHKNSSLTEKQIVEIKKLISQKTLSQSEIAKKYGVTQSTISKIKLNRRHQGV